MKKGSNFRVLFEKAFTAMIVDSRSNPKESYRYLFRACMVISINDKVLYNGPMPNGPNLGKL